MAKTSLKGIVEELKIRSRSVGIADSFGRIAILTPKKLISKQDQEKHDELVNDLQSKGYKIIYSSSEKPKKLSRDRVYDILTSHQSFDEWNLWSEADLKGKLKYIR